MTRHSFLALGSCLFLAGCAQQNSAPATFKPISHTDAVSKKNSSAKPPKSAVANSSPKKLTIPSKISMKFYELNISLKLSTDPYENATELNAPYYIVNMNDRAVDNTRFENSIPLMKKLNGPALVKLGGYSSVTPSSLKMIHDVKNIVGITYFRDDISDDDVKGLSKMTQLRILSLSGKGLSQSAFKNVAELVNLEFLYLSNRTYDFLLGDEDLESIKNLHKLRRLHLGGSRLTDKGMALLENFPNVQYLTLIGGKYSPKGIQNLKYLTNVRDLELKRVDVLEDDGFAFLQYMPKLKDLTIKEGPDISGKAGQYFQHLANLETLETANFTDEGMAGLANLKNLKKLNLLYSSLKGPGLKHLQGCENLQELHVSGEVLPDDAIKPIGELKNLEILSLNRCGLGDDCFDYLKNLTNLRELSLSETYNGKITGAKTALLTPLTNLEKVRFSGNPYTDKGVTPLGNFPKLKSVYLSGTRVSDAALLQLKKSRPDCLITDAFKEEVTLKKIDRPLHLPKLHDLRGKKPDVTLSAQEFYQEVKADEGAAEKKYKGKIIELTGTIKNIRGVYKKQWYAQLEGGGQHEMVECYAFDNLAVGQFSPGQKVKVVGEIPSSLRYIPPTLQNSVLTAITADPAIKVKAADLAKDYLADESKTLDKYSDKWVAVTGKVKDKYINSLAQFVLVLEGADKCRLEFEFDSYKRFSRNHYKIGSTATVKTNFLGVYSETKQSVVGSGCFPVIKEKQ